MILVGGEIMACWNKDKSGAGWIKRESGKR